MSEKREISEVKRRYLSKLGIDIDDLPEEFYQICQRCNYTDDMRQYLESSKTEVAIKEFCIGDIIGTDHSDYYDKSWFDFFVDSKRGDDIVRKYESNERYYSEYLKQPDQDDISVHDTMLELYEQDGKYFIKGGNNRISFIMMQYLDEMSKAKTDEERQAVRKKYTFYGEVRTLPRDMDFVPLTMYLDYVLDYKISYGGEEGHYICERDGETITLSSKEEMEDLVRDELFVGKTSPTEILDTIIDFSVHARLPEGVISGVIPNYNEIIGLYVDIRDNVNVDELLANYDYQRDGIAGLQQVLEREKIRIEKEKSKQEHKEEPQEIEDTQEPAVEEVEPQEDIEIDSYQEQDVSHEQPETSDDMERTTLNGKSIPRLIALDFNEMQKQQKLFMSLATKLGIDCSLMQVMDPMQYAQTINQLNKEMNQAVRTIDSIEDESRLTEIETRLDSIQTLFSISNLGQEFSEEMKSRFQAEFGKKVDAIIRDDKLSRLKMEYDKEAQKKFGLIGRIAGKKRLHDKKLENISLQQQLVQMEFEGKNHAQGMEESISELYSYLYLTYNKEVPPHLHDFVNMIDLDTDINTIFDKKKMQEMFQRKIQTKQKGELPIDISGTSTKSQIASMLRQNAELSEVIKSYSSNARKETIRQMLTQNRCTSVERLAHRIREAQRVVIFINGTEEQTRGNEEISNERA